MKVFLSWSDTTSHKVALTLRDWLPSVIQSVVPYVSSEDIDKGARWSTDIAKELEDSAFGILCVTKENLHAPWLTFEAGALSKKLDKAYVSPFLFDIKRSEINGPILQFQSTVFEREDIRKLVKTINKACGEEQLKEERLDKAFEVWYTNLEKELLQIKPVVKEVVQKKTENGHQEILEEILELTRINQKILRSPEIVLPPEYIRQILKDDKQSEMNIKISLEQQMLIREMEHCIFRLKDLVERNKIERNLTDEELEMNIIRLIELFQHYNHLEKRLKRTKFL